MAAFNDEDNSGEEGNGSEGARGSRAWRKSSREEKWRMGMEIGRSVARLL